MTNGQSGAAACEHLVTADNEPLPSQYRGMSAKAQEGYTHYLKTLKNRPIPDKYRFLPDTTAQDHHHRSADRFENRIDEVRCRVVSRMRKRRVRSFAATVACASG